MFEWPVIIVGAMLFVAYANGANDKFKGVATLGAALTVMLATQIGMPVSTTHVSCGALFGIGIANGQVHWNMIRTILMAWLLTVPVAALLSAGVYLSLGQL